MSWGDWYESVWTALVNKVKSLDDFDDENTFFGEKFPPEKYPSAYICPGEVPGQPKTMHESEYHPQFEIGIVVKKANAKTGFIDAFKYAGKIVGAIDADRTLGGAVHNVEVINIIPYWRGLGRGPEDHWVGVIVSCTHKM